MADPAENYSYEEGTPSNYSAEGNLNSAPGDIDPGSIAAANTFGISPEQAQEVGDAMGDIGPDGISPEQAETAANMVNEFGGTATPESVMGFAADMKVENGDEQYSPEGDMPPPAEGEAYAPTGEANLAPGDIDPGNIAAADAFGISPEQAQEIGETLGEMGPDGLSPEQAATAADMVNEFGGSATPESVMQFAEEVEIKQGEEHQAPASEYQTEGDMPPPPPVGEYQAAGDMPPPPPGDYAIDGDIPPVADGGWGDAPQTDSQDLGIAFTDSAAKDPAEATDPFAGATEAHDDVSAVPMIDSAADELASGIHQPEDQMLQDTHMADSGPDAGTEPPMDDQSGLV